jgi:hypothetical protein
LKWAITGYKPPGYGVKGLFATIEKHRPQIDKLTKVVALKTRSGMDGWRIEKPDRHDPDHNLWHGNLTEMPAEVYGFARRAEKGALDIAVVVGELNAKSDPVTVVTVAKFMGISRATFYRRGYAKGLRNCIRALTAQRTVRSR